MAATNDTIDGLLAEFRGYSAGMPPSYHVTMSWADFRKMLDRFEAAHKRELDALNEQITDLRQQRDLWSKRAAELVEKCNEQYAKLKQVGNAAKLREALNLCVDEMCARCRDLAKARGNPAPCLNGCEPVRKAKAALAAPPRNCDKYVTADEALKAQEQMFNDSNFANGECKLGCPECDNPRVGCKIAWLYAPATEKEGGNNANE